jgi:hypothetical protein
MAAAANNILTYSEFDGGQTIKTINIAEDVVPGESKRKRFIVTNNHPEGFAVELFPNVDNPNINVDRYPRTLNAGQSGEVDVTFTIPDNAISPPKGKVNFTITVLQKETVWT